MRSCLFLIYLFLTVSSALKAQQFVTGRISDASDGAPLHGAYFFIANTTIGVSSDEFGYYSITVPLEGSFEFVVSHVGYQSVFHTVDAPKSMHQIDVVMGANELEEITITARSNYRQTDVNLFWRKLLGVRPSNRGLEVINPEKVYFFRNSDNVLKVSCKEPIEIINHEMGYRIRYVLHRFEHDYRIDNTVFYGMPFFEELIPQNDRQKERWEKKRQEVYAVSITRFLRALYREQIHEEGFLLVEQDSVRNVIHSKDILQTNEETVQVNIESPLYLACVAEPVTARMIQNSWATIFGTYRTFPIMILQPQQFSIFPDGTYTGLLKVQEYQNSISGLSAMLPVEYMPATSHFDNFDRTVELYGIAAEEEINIPFDNDVNTFFPYIQALQNFSKYIPHEKVYLHFDNTSYYQGDNIWFKCYVVTSAQNQLSWLSKTLYVELLNPGGEIVDKRILKIEDGQCHGDFSLNHLPFYSGFYEVRAYTKYMLNFGDNVVFSRLLPVFDKPKTEGAFEEKNMTGYGRYGPLGGRPMKRESPVRGNNVNLRFFPEGGNLIHGVASRVAFEATDEAGNPIDVTGVVLDGNRQELSQITTLHEGRGAFTYIPAAGFGRRRDIAEVEFDGRKYQFDMPTALPQGVTMEIDNLTCPDSIGVTLRKTGNTPVEMFGVTVLNGGKLHNYCLAYVAKNEISFKMDKTRLPAGVSQIVLFNSRGEIVGDRLIFVNKNDNELLNFNIKTDKDIYRPHELVEMEISLIDRDANPVNATFSLSVRDGDNEVENNHNILTDLLLMSEIKGFVRNPSYYFEDNDYTRRAALDLLLMVQGWRRYSWEQMAGVEPFELKHTAEQGIETNGQVVSLNFWGRQITKPEIDVDLFLLNNEKENDGFANFVESFVTNDNGRFSFVLDVEGRWNMILSARERGIRKNNMILIDRVFSPTPRRYGYAELQINLAEKNTENMIDEEISVPEDNDFNLPFQDLSAYTSITEQTQQLSEVTVRGRRSGQAQDILRNRSTSVAYYNVADEFDEIYDSGKYIGDDIHQLMSNMNDDFSIRQHISHEFLYYKGRMTLFVVNYQKTTWNEFGYFAYRNVRLAAIKSIYINENTSTIAQYITPEPASRDPMQIAMRLGCVIFIETYPDGEIPTKSAKGVRKTWLEGYSAIRDFYSPNYSELPPAPDYRRTLYWNPSLTPDETGAAKIQFYNNSRSANFSISAETVTSLGMIGAY